MIKIENLQEFEFETAGDEVYCLFFGGNKSPTCFIMQKVLNEICMKRGYKFLYLDISNKKLYKLVVKYKTGVVPHFVFIKGDDIIIEGTGTFPKRDLDLKLKGWR